MCEGCTENITTGKRHVCENIICPGFMSDSAEKISAQFKMTWEPVYIDIKEAKAFTLRPLKPILPKRAVNKLPAKSVMEGVSRIREAYLSEKLELGKLFSMRHPLNPKNPYFRQILPCKGYLLIANTFSIPWGGVVKIYGEPDTLAKIVKKMLQRQLIPNENWKYDAKAFACNSTHHFNNEKIAKDLLSRDGLVKINGGYAFIVAREKKSEESGGERFCFMTDIEMITRLVRKELERKNNG